MADEQGQSEKAPKFKQLWKCPKCSNTLTLYISVSQPPTCNNAMDAVVMVRGGDE